VGGLPVAVRDGVSGALVDGHDTDDWAKAIGDLFTRDPATMRDAAVAHAAQFSWAHTVDALLGSYGRAMADFRTQHPPVEPSARRSGRRFSMRRGVRA
jgi:D-inositol-3-phosphate glycosyltransferase